ncbi:MAG: hypothetical protein J3R72DRAFT_224076 [Linnemannia gamsii]|nr:MAG: hypothetical protein J3R72DRAFT_224076 [Linnemannia gamsii]
MVPSHNICMGHICVLRSLHLLLVISIRLLKNVLLLLFLFFFPSLTFTFTFLFSFSSSSSLVHIPIATHNTLTPNSLDVHPLPSLHSLHKRAHRSLYFIQPTTQHTFFTPTFSTMVSRHSARDSQWLHTSPSLPQQQQQQQQQHRHHQQPYHYHSRENSINSISTNHTYQHNHSKSHSYPDLTSSGQHSPSFSNHHYNSSRTSPQTHLSSPATYKADNMMSSHQVSLFEGSPPLNTSRSSGNGQSHQHHHPQQQYHPARQQQQQMGYAPQHHQAHGSISNGSMNALAKTQQQQRSLSNPKRRIPKEKAPKGDREEVCISAMKFKELAILSFLIHEKIEKGEEKK